MIDRLWGVRPAAVAAVVAVAALGLSGCLVPKTFRNDGGGDAGAKATSASSVPASPRLPPVTGPMEKMPSGTKVPLVRPGRLTICEGFAGSPYIAPKGGTTVPGRQGGGTAEGFDVDLLILVAERLGVTPLVTPVQSLDLVQGTAMRQGRCDLAAGAFPDNAYTRKLFLPSAPYLRRGPAILTGAGARHTSLASLAGKRVGVIEGDVVGEEAVKRHNAQGGTPILVQRTERAIIQYMLMNGRLDAAVVDGGLALYLVNRRVRDGRLRIGAELGPMENVVFGIRPGNKALARQVNAALADAARNGRYARAYANWFGTAPKWVPTG